MSNQTNAKSKQLNQPLVTIFVPLYNSQSFVSEAIESLLNQTYTNFELLVIDDGSTDQSLDIISKMADSRIQVVQNNKNMGIGYTSNKALELAKGKYLMRLDADDIAKPQRLAKQVARMEEYPKITVLGGQAEFFGSSGGLSNLPLRDNLIKARFLTCAGNISNPTSMLRMDFFREHAIRYDTTYPVAEDLGFWVGAAIKGAVFANLPEILIKYRIHPANASTSKGGYLVEALKPIRAILLKAWFPNLTDDEVGIINPLLHSVGGTITITKQVILDGTAILKRLQSETQASWMGEDRVNVFRFMNFQIEKWSAYL